MKREDLDKAQNIVKEIEKFERVRDKIKDALKSAVIESSIFGKEAAIGNVIYRSDFGDEWSTETRAYARSIEIKCDSLIRQLTSELNQL